MYLQLSNENIIIVIPIVEGAYFNIGLLFNDKQKKLLTVTVPRNGLFKFCKNPLFSNEILVLTVKDNILQLCISSEQFHPEAEFPIKKHPHDKDISFSVFGKDLCDAVRYLSSYKVDINIYDNPSICVITKHDKWEGWGKRPISPIKAVEIIGIRLIT